MSHEEDGSDAQEWKEIIDEEDETSESLSRNLVDKNYTQYTDDTGNSHITFWVLRLEQTGDTRVI